MKRLTKFNGSRYIVADEDNFDSYEPYVQKVGKIEDLEEQLGCPLEVLWKLRTAESITIKGEKGEFETWETDNFTIDLKNLLIWVHIERTDWIDSRPYYLKDYKKTLWLKADRSE
ncbi:MAG: hypothetical protein ACI4WW_02765 [Candidatus Coprovivens sp.]